MPIAPVDYSGIINAAMPIVLTATIGGGWAQYRKLQVSHAETSEEVAVLKSQVNQLQEGERTQNARHDRFEQTLSDLRTDVKSGFARVEALLSPRQQPRD